MRSANERLWFRQPARYWNSQVLHLGNGHLGAFSSFGKLLLETGHDSAPTRDYLRELDFATGIGAVEYSVGGVRYKREYLCSNPHRVLAIRIAGDREGSIRLKTRWSLLHSDQCAEVNGDTLQVTGAVNGNRRRFSITTHILVEKGTVTALADSLEVDSANAVVILIAAVTEYRAHAPSYGGADPVAITRAQCDTAAAIGFDELRSAHISDYQSLYRRVSLSVSRAILAE